MLISELLEKFQCQTVSPLSDDFVIKGVRPLALAEEGDLSFLSNPKYRNQVKDSGASAILVKDALPDIDAVQILCKDPYVTLARVLAHMFPEPKPEPGIHPSAVVDAAAVVHPSAYVGPHCLVEAGAQLDEGCILTARVTVGRDARVGSFSKLFPGVVLYAGVTLGSMVRVHANTVIGSDGFGYAQVDGIHLKVPQIGSVIVEDGVEIGASTCIDRGALDNTVIGAGSIIDNQVQIAHGVKMGRGCIIVAQSGISGSAELGNYVVLAGQVGVVGHVKIADQVMVMGDSVVTKNLEKSGRYAGNPAVPAIKYQKQLAHQRMLPQIKARIKELEARLPD